MLEALAKLLAVLNSETEPGQITLGFCFAMVAGFPPLWSLHNILVLLLVLLLRVNLSAFLLGLGFFSAVAFTLDPLFHRLGLAVLTASSLEPLWTALYNQTLWRLEQFNDSIVMGSLLVSLVLFVPLLFTGNALIVRYRVHVLAWVQRMRIMKWLKVTQFWRLYERVSSLRKLA